MRKLLFLAVMLVSSLAALAEDNYVSVGTAVSKDLKKATVNVDLTNNVQYVAFQMDIVFPSTMKVTSSAPTMTARLVDESGNPENFSVAYRMVDDYTLRVLAYNMDNRAIAGTSGDRLFSVTLTDANGIATEAADWTPTLKDVLFVAAEDLKETNLTAVSETEGYLLGDVNEDGKVTALDITATVAVIFKTSEASKYDAKKADVNGDEKVTALDVTKIVEIIFNE